MLTLLVRLPFDQMSSTVPLLATTVTIPARTEQVIRRIQGGIVNVHDAIPFCVHSIFFGPDRVSMSLAIANEFPNGWHAMSMDSTGFTRPHPITR